MDMFAKFKLHAEKLHKDVKELEKTYLCPQTFFGTTVKSALANEFLKNELQEINKLNENVQELLQELEKTVNDNEALFNEVEQAKEGVKDLITQVEKYGFTFQIDERKTESSNITQNRSQEVVDEDEKSGNTERRTSTDDTLIIVSPLLVEENNDVCQDEIDTCMFDEKNVEKYLEENNIDLEDIVTPYIPRKSLYAGKKT